MSASNPSRLLSELALLNLSSNQRGLVTTAQARNAGWRRQRLHRWHRSGRLTRLHPGVYSITGVPTDWEQEVLAAVLAAGPGAVASRRSAMALHGIAPATRSRATPIEVSIPQRRDAKLRGVTVHRVILPRSHTTTVDGIPCTTSERTLLDSAARLGRAQLARGLDQGLVTNQVTLESARTILGELRSAPGRRGGVSRS